MRWEQDKTDPGRLPNAPMPELPWMSDVFYILSMLRITSHDLKGAEN